MSKQKSGQNAGKPSSCLVTVHLCSPGGYEAQCADGGSPTNHLVFL